MSDETTSVRVGLRIRPQISREKFEMCRICTSVTVGEPQVLLGSDRAFTFDYVFDTDAQQEIVYENCVRHLIEGCFDGYNATVLAYGQTGSGKTYTMGTGFDVILAPEEHGIIPRAVEHLFSGIIERQRTAIENGTPKPEFKIEVQFIELYNEEILDLLEEGRDIETSRTKKSNIKIHEDNLGNIYLNEVTKCNVSSAEETMKVLRNGALGRTTASTNMNVQSSRSHAIFSIIVRQQRIICNYDAGNEISQPDFEVLTAKFHFVDLAGSERLKRTGATGDRAKEGININCGLLALGNVISALGDVTKKASHVPYRDSKLTRLLQDSLGGNSRTLMIACISPSDIDFVETLNTLKYANRAKNIKNRVVVNQDRSSRLITELRCKIQQLELELMDFKQGKRMVGDDGGESLNDMYQENIMLQSEVNQLRVRVKALQTTVETMRTRNVQMISERDCRTFVDGESDPNEITALVQKYIEEIEEMRTRLCESESTCEVLRRQLSKLKSTNIYQNNVPTSPIGLTVSHNGTASMTNGQFMSSSCLESFSSMSVDAAGLDSSPVMANVETILDAAKKDIESLKEKVKTSKGAENTLKNDETEHDDDEDDDDDDESDDDDISKYRNDLADLQSEITLKERLVEQLEQSQKRLHALKAQYEEKLAQLQQRIYETESERDRALAAFGSQVKTQVDQVKAEKIRSDYEDKLRTMRSELQRLQCAKKEHQRLVREQQENHKQMTRLQNELHEMKSTKVLLMKKMKEESNKARIIEMKRLKEVSQLQKDARKREVELRTLKMDQQKREMIFKRKQEELQTLRRLQKPTSGKANVGSNRKLTIDVEKPFSAKNAKHKWTSIEKNISSQVTKKQTVLQMEQELERLMQRRENLRLKLEDLKTKKIAVAKLPYQEIESSIMNELTDQIDSLQTNMDYYQEAISECQKQIMEIEDSKEESESPDTDNLSVDCDNLEEAKYVIQHMYNLCVAQGTNAAQKEASNKELEAKLQQVQHEYVVHEQLLKHIIGNNPEAFGIQELTMSRSSDSRSSTAPSPSIDDCDFPNWPSFRNDNKARRRTATPDELLYSETTSIARVVAPTLPVVHEDLSPSVAANGNGNGNGSRTRDCSPEKQDNPSSTNGENSNHAGVEALQIKNGTVSSQKQQEIDQLSSSASTNETRATYGSIENIDSDNKLMPPPPLPPRRAHSFVNSNNNSKLDSVRTNPNNNGLVKRQISANSAVIITSENIPMRKNLDTVSSPSFSRGQPFRNTISCSSLPVRDSHSSTERFCHNGPHPSSSPPPSPRLIRRQVEGRNVFSRLTANSSSFSNLENSSNERRSSGCIYPISSQSSKHGALICTHVAEGHSRAVLTLAATDSMLASGSKDRTVRVWDLEKLTSVCTLPPHPNNVVCVRLLPESNLLFAVSMSQVKIWDLRSQTCVKTLSSSGLTVDGDPSPNLHARQMTLNQNESMIYQIEFNNENTCLFTAAYNQIRIWDLRNYAAVGKLVSATVNSKSEVSAFTLFPSVDDRCGFRLAAGSRDHYIKIFELPKGPLTGVYEPKYVLEPPHYDGVTCLKAINDNLFSGSRDQHLVKWDLENKKRSHQITNAHRQWILSLSSLPGNESVLVSSCREGSIKLWDTTNCAHLGEIRCHQSAINCLARNSTCLFTASNDASIGIWKPRPKFVSGNETSTVV